MSVLDLVASVCRPEVDADYLVTGQTVMAYVEEGAKETPNCSWLRLQPEKIGNWKKLVIMKPKFCPTHV